MAFDNSRSFIVCSFKSITFASVVEAFFFIEFKNIRLTTAMDAKDINVSRDKIPIFFVTLMFENIKFPFDFLN